MANHEKIDFSEAIKRIESLHGNMSVLAMLSQLLRDTNANLEDATRLIETDGPLTTSIIRISNSAFYSGSQKNRDVHSALQHVGLDEALRIVGIAISKQVFMRDLDAYGITADYYWTNSYFCGTLMEFMAKRIGLEVNEAYLLGLLHAIGKVVINEILIDKQVEIYWDPALPSEEWEDIMVGFRYTHAGATLLANWAFSEFLCDRIERQSNQDERNKDPLLTLLSFSREVIELNRCNLNNSEWSKPTEHPAYEFCEPEILDMDISNCVTHIQELYQSIKQFS